MLVGWANNFALIWRISQLLSWAVYLALEMAYILRAPKGQHESWWCPKTRAREKKISKKNTLISSRVFLAEGWSGIASFPIFVGPGLLGIGPGLPGSQFLWVWDCSGLGRDCQDPNFCESRIGRDWSGIARIPVFVGPGLLGVGP